MGAPTVLFLSKYEASRLHSQVSALTTFISTTPDPVIFRKKSAPAAFLNCRRTYR
jgi:hypothetical protein